MLIIINRKKAQLFTLDAIFGFTIFIFIFFTFLNYFINFYQNLSLQLESKKLELTSYYAINQLLSSGKPENWNYNLSSLIYLGLERERGVLDPHKISTFRSLFLANKSLVKEKLRIFEYNFSFVIIDFYSKTTLYNVSENHKFSNLYMLERVAVLNNSLVIVKLGVGK